MAPHNSELESVPYPQLELPDVQYTFWYCIVLPLPIPELVLQDRAVVLRSEAEIVTFPSEMTMIVEAVTIEFLNVILLKANKKMEKLSWLIN